MNAYRPSPRPVFDRATALRRAEVTRHVWGDTESGEVLDWIYVSSSLIHQIVFGLPVGSSFRHSDAFRTIFAADEVLHVLSGEMMLSNPSTGEAQRVNAGEAAFFRRDTWHHAHAVGTDQLRVLEIFAPPPAAGASGSYARTKELLTDVRLADDALLGRLTTNELAAPGPNSWASSMPGRAATGRPAAATRAVTCWTAFSGSGSDPMAAGNGWSYAPGTAGTCRKGLPTAISHLRVPPVSSSAWHRASSPTRATQTT